MASIYERVAGTIEATAGFIGPGALLTGIPSTAVVDAAKESQVAIWTPTTGVLGSEAQLALARGGTGSALTNDVSNSILVLPATTGGVTATLKYSTSSIANSIVQRDSAGAIVLDATTLDEITQRDSGATSGQTFTKTVATITTAATTAADLFRHPLAGAATAGAYGIAISAVGYASVGGSVAKLKLDGVVYASGTVATFTELSKGAVVDAALVNGVTRPTITVVNDTGALSFKITPAVATSTKWTAKIEVISQT